MHHPIKMMKDALINMKLNMKKIINILLFTTLFFVFLNHKIEASADYFNFLENLKIGQQIPESIKTVGKIIDKGNPNEINYLLNSSKFSQPHLVKINLDEKLLYLELKIPQNKIDLYRQYYQSLGEPESYLVKATSQTLASYPSKGIGFVVDEQNENDLKIIKFPATSTEKFEQINKKNYNFTSETNNTNDETNYNLTDDPIDEYNNETSYILNEISLVSDIATPIIDETSTTSTETNPALKKEKSVVEKDDSITDKPAVITEDKPKINIILLIVSVIIFLGLIFLGYKYRSFLKNGRK